MEKNCGICGSKAVSATCVQCDREICQVCGLWVANGKMCNDCINSQMAPGDDEE